MKLILLVWVFFVTGSFAGDAPLQYADLAKAGFGKVEWKRLTDSEKADFYKVYPADREMLDRVRIGDEDTVPLEECVVGEAPSVEEALEKFPLHYPLLGRMKEVAGVFEWRGRSLVFRTARQLYPTDEAHIHLRLKQLGFSRGSAPRKATIEAVWFVSHLDGLRILYLQKVQFD